MADIDAHLVDADPNSGFARVAKDVFAGTCGGIGMYISIVNFFFFFINHLLPFYIYCLISFIFFKKKI